jgi:limonene-1,2-epoxide hydrolase
LKEYWVADDSGNEEVKDDVKTWLNGLAAEDYDAGIQRLVTSCDQCLNVGGG